MIHQNYRKPSATSQTHICNKSHSRQNPKFLSPLLQKPSPSSLPFRMSSKGREVGVKEARQLRLLLLSGGSLKSCSLCRDEHEPATCSKDNQQVDLFIQQLYDEVKVEGQEWVAFADQGGMYFDQIRKQEFIEMLAKTPQDRKVPNTCPTEWSEFVELMKSYDFEHKVKKGFSRFIHPEFRLGGRLHLIQKGTIKVDPRARLTLDPAMFALHPLWIRQGQITFLAQRVLQSALKFNSGGFKDLTKHAAAIEKWSSICGKELISIMKLWNYGYSQLEIKGVGGLLWKHEALLDVIEELIAETVQGKLDADLIVEDGVRADVVGLVLKYQAHLTVIKRLVADLEDALLHLKGQQ